VGPCLRCVLSVGLLAAAGAGVAAPTSDACAGLLPATLVASLETAHPGFRAPREDDNEPDDVAYAMANAQRGCLGIDTGDFDADGRADFIVALASGDGSDGYAVVVGLARKRGWRVELLSQHHRYRHRVFVETAGPGHFRRSEALEGPPSPGWPLAMTCARQAAMYGHTESTATVACRVRGRWIRVQTVD
jgi:hypothetical protein